MMVDDLLKMRKQVQADVVASTRSTGDPVLDEKPYTITEEEASRGWLEGPLSAEHLQLAGAWIPSRRFAVVQGEKVRPVDDYTVSFVNSTVEVDEAIDPQDLDAIVANARLHADAFVAPEGERHSSSPSAGVAWHQDYAGSRLLGRMWDLSSAYKNLPVRPS